MSDGSRVLNRAATIVIARRGVVLIIAAILTVIAIIGASRLEFDDQPRRLFESGGEAFQELYELFADFGADDGECLVVIESADALSLQSIRFQRAVAQTVRGVPGVDRTTSIIDVLVFNGVTPRPLIDPARETPLSGDERRSILAHPLVGGFLISEDGSTALIRAELSEDLDEVREIGPVVESIRSRLSYALAQIDTAGTMTASVTGIPPLRVEIIDTIRREQVRFLGLGSVLGVIIAWLMFRRVIAVAIAVGVPMIGATWTLGLLGWIGESVNVINAVLPTLVLVIGFTDSVHLMVDMRRSRALGIDPGHASIHAIRHLGTACALTSLTTVVGFGSLGAASVDVIQRFGLACAAGTFITFVAVVTLGPVCASLVPMHRLARPRTKSHEKLERRASQMCAFLIRHARAVAVTGVIVTIALAIIASQLRPDNRLAESIPDERESPRAMRHVDKTFGGILQVFVVVDWPADASMTSPATIDILNRLHTILNAHELTNHPLSIRTIMAALPGRDDAERAQRLGLVPDDLMTGLVRDDRRRLLVIARVRDVGAAQINPGVKEIESQIDDVRRDHPEYSITVTGTTVIAAHNLHLMIGDLARSLGIAAVVIFITLSLAFRSLRIGLISIVPNVFPLVVTAAFVVVLGRALEITSVIVFSVCLGIAVDDTIHVLTKFRRERADGYNVADALTRSFLAVGAALVITTVVLLSGFGSVMLSEVPAIRLFAMLAVVAIGAALVGDLLILPALIAIFVRDTDDRSPE